MSSPKSYVYNVICPVCGFKKKNYELKRRWDNIWVCANTCWEPRHPLDFYKTRNDAHKLPFTYPDVDGPDVSPQTHVTVPPIGGNGPLGVYGKMNFVLAGEAHRVWQYGAKKPTVVN